MSTNIDQSLIKQFIFKTAGTSFNAIEAKKLGLEDEYNQLAEELDTNEINWNDIEVDTDLYEQFAVMYANEEETETAKDEEKEKEEQSKVSGKNEAGV